VAVTEHVLASGRRGELAVVAEFCRLSGLTPGEGMGMLAAGLVRPRQLDGERLDLVSYTSNIEHLRAATRSYALLSRDHGTFEGEVPGVAFSGKPPNGWVPVWQWSATNKPGAILDELQKCFANYGLSAVDGVELLVHGKIRLQCVKEQDWYRSKGTGRISGTIFWPYQSVPEIHAALEEVRRGPDDEAEL
jgi:hypothetical protein